MKRILELKQKRGKALADARAINDAAAAEGRSLSAEERANYEKHMGDFKALGDDIQREELLAREELNLAAVVDQQVDLNSRSAQGGEGRANSARVEQEVRAFNQFIRTGESAELRALQVDANTSGGFLVAPQQVVGNLIQAVDNAVIMRQLATVIRVERAESLGVPSLDTDPDDPTWTSEILTGTADASMAFGKRELRPHPLAAKLLVSETMLRRVPGVESIIMARMGYKMGIKQENAYLNGTGDQQPLGIFTASTQGITTARDISTSNTTTAVTVDGLKRAKGALKVQYRASGNCRWIFHPDVVTEIALLKDGNGRYLLQDSITDSEPERLLGIPMLESQYAPSTMTTGLYVGALGDFSHYLIADALDVQIRRLVELYAATNQVGFHVRAETDGMPDLAEAFVRVKLA